MGTMDEAMSVRTKLRKFTHNYLNSAPLARGQVGALIGRCNTVFGGDLNRRKVWAYLFDGGEELHAQEMSAAEWQALWQWVGFFEEEGVWHTSDEFNRDVVILTTALLNKAEV